MENLLRHFNFSLLNEHVIKENMRDPKSVEGFKNVRGGSLQEEEAALHLVLEGAGW